MKYVPEFTSKENTFENCNKFESKLMRIFQTNPF